MRTLILFLAFIFTFCISKAQSKSDSTSFKGNYKRQNEVMDQNKSYPSSQKLEYVDENSNNQAGNDDNYKHSVQQQMGGVLPTKPVEKKPNGFYSNRNYKHQF